MDEQPVALAITARSPKSCVSVLMYGVSPQPAHAPGNSNSGSNSCRSFTVWKAMVERSVCGSVRKKSQLRRSCSRMGACGARLTAFFFASLLLLAGHTSMHSPQPVQSSGETCSTYRIVWRSFHRAMDDLNSTGALASADGSHTLARITACGQTKIGRAH